MCDCVYDEDISEIRNDKSRCEEFVQLCAALKAFVGNSVDLPDSSALFEIFGKVGNGFSILLMFTRSAVSYTHLTLPTIYSV